MSEKIPLEKASKKRNIVILSKYQQQPCTRSLVLANVELELQRYKKRETRKIFITLHSVPRFSSQPELTCSKTTFKTKK